MHEVLLELDDGLDGAEAKFLDSLAHACELVDLHADVNHHVQVANSTLQDLAQTLLEDRVANVIVIEHVAQDEQKWLRVHRCHVP